MVVWLVLHDLRIYPKSLKQMELNKFRPNIVGDVRKQALTPSLKLPERSKVVAVCELL
jgi:hypothetical protein